MDYSRYTNQQIINAFYKAAQALNAAGANYHYWKLITQAHLTHLADNRAAPYTDTPIQQLPLPQEVIDEIIAQLQQMIPDLQTPVSSTASKLLPVPWISQLGPEAPDKADCGHACVLMLLKYYDNIAPGGASESIISNVTVPQLVEMMKRIDVEQGRPARSANYTSARDLIDLAKKYGLTLSTTTAPFNNPDQAIPYIDQNRPVIPLVNYADLGFPVHLGTGVDQGLHWLIIVGYEDGGNTLLVNDPLWGPEREADAKSRPISKSQLDAALVPGYRAVC